MIRLAGWMALAALGLAALGGGCGKRGAPLPPLRVAAAELAELKALARGPRIVLDAPLPLRYADGEAFVLQRVRVLLRPGTIGVAEVAVPRPAPPALASPPHSPVIADRAATPVLVAPPAVPAPERFLKEANRVLEIEAGSALASAIAGDRVRVEIDSPALAFGRVAVAMQLFGQRKGDRGRLSPIVLVRVGPTPEAPAAPRVEMREDGIHVAVGASEAAPRLLFRRLSELGVMPGDPVGGKLIAPHYLDATPTLGSRACYAVAQLVDREGDRAISGLSGETCVVRRDTFAPDPPTRLLAFASGEGVLLSWTGSRAADLRGYRVYRKVDGGTREPLVEGPAVTGTSYLDSGAPRGRRLAYQVSSVDGAEPPNESAATAWVEAQAEPPSYR